jgi:predicted nucleotidyltransferase
MAYVFGSFAKGRAMRESDIDIAVYFKSRGRTIEWEEEKYYLEENEIWEDFYENLLANQRANEPGEYICYVKGYLKNKVNFIPDYTVIFFCFVYKEV